MEDINSNLRRFSVVSHEKPSPVQWEEIKELSGKIYSSYHVVVSIDNYLFVHGGIKQEGSLKPTNDFHRINMETYQIEILTSDESPSLSQHTAVVLSKNYIVFVGGWNGHSRMSSIWIFDSKSLKWLKPPVVEGFAKNAGLSSHTANASLKSNAIYPDIVVIGREGSTRLQRRYGNAFRLKCNSNLTKFSYSDLTLNVDSRSAHCTVMINSKMYIVGGRDDKFIDIHLMKNLISDRCCNVVSELIERFKEFDLPICPLVGRRKAGRRGHCLVPGKNGFIVAGGSSFIEANHVADTAAFLYVITGDSETYYFLGSMTNARGDGGFTVTNNHDSFYHGGIDVNGKIRSEVFKLKLIVD